MFTPDYDDYYALDDYAARFLSDVDDTLKVYFNQVSTMNLITLWEMKNGNDLFRPDVMEEICNEIRNGHEFEPSEIRDRCNILSYFLEDGKIMADLDVYNDFVAFLGRYRINTY